MPDRALRARQKPANDNPSVAWPRPLAGARGAGRPANVRSSTKQRRERGAGGGLGCGCGRLQPSTSGPMGLSEKVTSQQKSEGHDGVSGPGISPVR